MKWVVDFHDDFDPEYRDLDEDVQDELLAHVKLLQQFGPQLGRPWADTLNGSEHTNMKELRFDAAGGVWRVAFDADRQAIILAAGDKAGVSERQFYRHLIEKADERFNAHLVKIKKRREQKTKKERKNKKGK